MNILSKQYESICSKPRESIDSEFMSFLLDNSDIKDMCKPNMSEIIFSYEDTRKIISKLSNGAVKGPDGLWSISMEVI